MTDEIAEAAKNEWFNPTKPLRDETEGERFKRIVKTAITAALAAMPGSVDWRKVLLDDKPTEEMRHYAHTAYAASGDLMDACRAFVRAAPLTPSAIRAEGWKPGGVDQGCKCQGCGNLYRVDITVPDELWNRIRPEGKPEGAGLLCGHCIVSRVEALGEFATLTALSTPAMPGGVDSLRSKPDFHSDPVEQLAFELAFELEEADLKPDDLVTVNREKLRAIAKRVLYRLTASREDK